ncbi:MAG: flagellar FliL protein [bacterium]|jgi:flagellar FliL protein
MSEEELAANENETDDDEELEEGGSSKKKIIIIAVLLIVLAGGATGAFLFLKRSPLKKLEKIPIPYSKLSIEEELEFATNQNVKPILTPPLDYTVLLRKGKRTNRLKIKLAFAIKSKSMFPYLIKRLPIANDIVLRILRVQDADKLSTNYGKLLLKKQLLVGLNQQMFTSEQRRKFDPNDLQPIRQALFYSFFIQ